MSEAFLTDNWDSYLQLFKPEETDIYFTTSYVQLYARGHDEPQCFVYQEDQNVFLFPMIKRRIEHFAEGRYFDFETPYGYGGPLSNTKDHQFLSRAVDAFMDIAYKQKIIAGFIRFHPLLNNQDLWGDRCTVNLNRQTVVLDLSLSPESLSEQLHSTNRKNIRKALKAGVSCHIDEEWTNYHEFVDMYHQNMRELGADAFYHFDEHYFDQIKRLKKNILLSLVCFDHKIIAAGLFFRYGPWGHTHLSCSSLTEYKQYKPNDVLIYQTAVLMQAKGLRKLHLGGGTDSSPENSLYQFKKRFSHTEARFCIGKMMVNEAVYQKICASWEDKFPEKKIRYGNYFLKYHY